MPWDLGRDVARAFDGPGHVTVSSGAEMTTGYRNEEDLDVPDETGEGRVVLAGRLLWIRQGAMPGLQAALLAGQEPSITVDGASFRARGPRRQGAGAYLQVTLLTPDGV